MFALDVKVRCHRIHSDMHRMYNGNVTKVASLMPRVIKTTLDCYGGDCKKCRYSSVVCSGGKGNWINFQCRRKNVIMVVYGKSDCGPCPI